MGGSVGVATHNGHPRLGSSQLGPDDVHDALIRTSEGKVGERPGSLDIRIQRLDLLTSQKIGDFAVVRVCRCVVIRGGDDAAH